METIIPIIIAAIASTGFWSFVSLCYNRKRTDQDVLLALIRAELNKIIDKYIDKESITRKDYETFAPLFRLYIAKGGNHTIKAEGDRIMDLPIRK